ncbi:MAG: Mrp/NBP35 family ATP-binding protein [Caldilineae bacterium]|nr:Mrp/NBP35 family ATP-binding protein [Anaerolineae bacterium]MCB9153750.1 Mrp/NBP35 family ATP-binding protein [Caldilineae bacterium]
MFNKKNGNITEKDILAALSTVQEPELHDDLVSLNMVKDIHINGGQIGFTIVLTTPACPLRGQMEREATEAVQALPGVEQVAVKFDANVRGDQRIAGMLNIPVRNIVAIASGKGGVGKSTVAVNLAVALAQQGARTGILDADIYGPNIPTMMGLTRDSLPAARDGKLVPPLAYGVEVMSMGFLIPPGEAVIWRGPMLHGAIRQLFTDVMWGELDYLIVDMPPGTGDATLTLAQSVPVTGGIIVSTPQNVALEDAEKGLVAFRKLQVPVLGIIENMAGDIFGEGGGERAAQRLHVPFLGRVYLDGKIRRGGDAGQPIVAIDPDNPQSQAFHELAQAVAARVSVMSFQSAPELKII